mmetsp:Transcript_43192/g.99575  ORF Transcript_43192/g.99575 Transcript_43192/m.99575 type:complete len:447 (-) Transcript_43192:78-1418(-)
MAAARVHRLEVQVLAARGLESESRVRRRVEFIMTSPEDPDGDTFGSNVTPWTVPRGMAKNQLARWGKLGQRCTFSLIAEEDGEKTQDELNAFIQRASLKINLQASKVPLKNSFLREAKMMLPTSIMETVTDGLDEATAVNEAEAIYTVKELLAGTAPGGINTGAWIRLRPTQIGGANSCMSSPEMWIQIYALPEHKLKVAELKQSLEAAVTSLDDPEGFNIANSQQDASKDEQSAALATEHPPESRVPRMEAAPPPAAATPALPATTPAAQPEKQKPMQEVSLIDMSYDDLIDCGKVEQTVSAVPIATTSGNATAAPDSFAADFATHGQPAPGGTQDVLASLYAQSPPMTTNQLKYSAFSEVGKATNGAVAPQAMSSAELAVKPQPALSNVAASVPENGRNIPSEIVNGNSGNPQQPPVVVTQQKKETIQSLEQQLLAGLSDSLKF